jgi:hypothetical protein
MCKRSQEGLFCPPRLLSAKELQAETRSQFSRRSCGQHRNQYQANRIDQRMYYHYYEQVTAEEKYKGQNKSEDARNQKSRSPSKEPGVSYREGSKRQQSG